MDAIRGEGEELRSEINVTPLVDVMLVLLVIFMVVTPLLHVQVPVELPIARTSEDPSPREGQVTLTLTADGRVLLDGTPVADDALESALRTVAGRTDRTLFLEADRSLAYDAVVRVMDAARAAGVTRIGILTERPPSRGAQ